MQSNCTVLLSISAQLAATKAIFDADWGSASGLAAP
jgi:hypothetical protein